MEQANEPPTKPVMSRIKTFPNELLIQICEDMDMKTLANFRSICKLFGDAAATVFFDSLANKYVLYPRAENMARYLKMLDAIPFLEEYVQELQVVRDTISVHKHGYEWTWKGVPGSQHWTSSDLQLATDIEEIHQEELTKTTQYLMKGGFYNDLTKILRKCTHLKWMVVRHLHPGEHIPGWMDMRLFKQFSFYTPSINLSKVYYGPYLYDRKHKMITCYLDEFDDDVIMMPGVREKDQAGFPEDLKNAYDESNSKAVYNYFFADETRKYDDLPCTLSHRMLARQVYGRTVV